MRPSLIRPEPPACADGRVCPPAGAPVSILIAVLEGEVWITSCRPPRADERRLPGVRVALGFYLVLVAVLLVGGGLLIGLLAVFGLRLAPETQPAVALSVLFQAALILGVLWLFLKRGRFGAKEALRLSGYRRAAVYLLAPPVLVSLGLVLGRLALPLVDAVPGLDPGGLLRFIRTSRLGEPGAFALFAGAISLGPGLTEELAFRGFILTGLRSTLGPAPAVALTAVLFALVHLDPLHVILAFPPGLLLGYLVVRTGSLYPAILSHSLNNLWSTLEAGLWQSLRPEIEPEEILFGTAYPPVALGAAAIALVGGLALIHRLTGWRSSGDRPA